MTDITHVILVGKNGVKSVVPINYDGGFHPTLAQVRRAAAVPDDAEIQILDLRGKKVVEISATDGPDGLQNCSNRDLGLHLDQWSSDPFSAISQLSEDLIRNVIPIWVETACCELRMIEHEVGEVLEEEVERAHALADELERRFSWSAEAKS